GAPPRRISRIGCGYREAALAVGSPEERRVSAGTPGDHLDALGHHERRIEADAEPTDQCRTFGTCGTLGRFTLRRFEPIQERLRARARDGAECLDHLVAAHADTVVLDHK